MKTKTNIYLVSYHGQVLYAMANKESAMQTIEEELDDGEKKDDYRITDIYLYDEENELNAS